MKTGLLMVIASGYLCLPFSLQATEEADPLSIQKLLSLSMPELFELKVKVASKTLENVFEAPSSVTVFSRRELQAMGLTSIEEVLNFVPGFFSTKEVIFGSGYTVSARGQTSPQASYNILFMIDGKRLNDETGGGALAINHYLPLHNVKQIEIIRGPGSALYGTSAFLGVVNIVTAQDVNQAFISAGDIGQREIYVAAAQQNIDWGVSASTRYFKDDGKVYAGTIPGEDPRSGRDVALNLRYKKLSLGLRYMDRQTTYPHEEAATDTLPNYSHTDQTDIHVTYKGADTAKYTWTVSGGYTEYQTDILARDSGAESLLSALFGPVPILNGEVSKEHGWHLNLDGSYWLTSKHELFAGLTWRKADIDKNRFQVNFDYGAAFDLLFNDAQVDVAYYGNTARENSVSVNETGRDIFGVYVQDKYHIHDQVSATLGVRYDHYSDFGQSVNPRLALLYSPRRSTQFKWLYGEAFRAPSLRQISGQPGNAQLNAEKIKTAEMAWLQSYPQHKLQTTLTYFYNWHSDLIDTTPNGGIQIFANQDGIVKTSGLELEASIQPIQNLSLRLAYTYLPGGQDTSRYFPQQSVALILNYQLPNWNFNLNGYFHDDVEYRMNRTTFIPLESYWHFNAAIRYRVDADLHLVARVNNLLDEEYFSASKVLGLSSGMPYRGRTANVGIEFSW